MGVGEWRQRLSCPIYKTAAKDERGDDKQEAEEKGNETKEELRGVGGDGDRLYRDLIYTKSRVCLCDALRQQDEKEGEDSQLQLQLQRAK